MTVEEQADAAADFTRGLVDAFGFDADVSTRREDEDTVIVDVTGGDLGLLVGPKGVTLQAIEELVRTAVQRQTEGHGARIHVDVGGYRAKRRAALEQFAVSIAEEVRDSGEGRALEPMSASDRKAVHDAVADLDGVADVVGGRGSPPAGGHLPRLIPSLIRCHSTRSCASAQDLGLFGPGDSRAPADPRRGLRRPGPGAARGRGARSFLDLGSGGGLPGFVLAEALPRTAGTLLDSQRRRTAFLARPSRSSAGPTASGS